MADFIKALFSDNGSVSMMRVLSLICVLTAAGIAIHAITVGADLNATSILCSTFLGAGFAGKVIQKSMEAKSGNGKQDR